MFCDFQRCYFSNVLRFLIEIHICCKTTTNPIVYQLPTLVRRFSKTNVCDVLRCTATFCALVLDISILLYKTNSFDDYHFYKSSSIQIMVLEGREWLDLTRYCKVCFFSEDKTTISVHACSRVNDRGSGILNERQRRSLTKSDVEGRLVAKPRQGSLSDGQNPKRAIQGKQS